MVLRFLAILLLFIGVFSQSLYAQCPDLELVGVNSNGEETFVFCEGETITYAFVFGTPCDFSTITTLFTSDSTVIDFIDNQTNFDIIAPPVSQTQNVEIEVTIESVNGIETFTFPGFTINPNVELSITADADDICIGGSTTISLDFDIPGGDIVIESQPQGEIVFQQDNILGNNIQVLIEPDEPTNYVITYDNDICSQQILYSPNVIVVDSIIIAGGDDAICQGDSITLAIQNLEEGNYLWSGVDIPAGTTGSEVTFSPQFSQLVSVNYSLPDPPFCTISEQILIQVQTPPNVIINPENPTICSGQVVTLTANSLGVQGFHNWTDQFSISSSGPTIQVSDTEPFSIAYQFTDNNFCTFTDTIEVSISDEELPMADFTLPGDESSSFCADSEITLINNSLNATSYLWNMPGASPSTSTDQVPIISYDTDGVYSIELIVSGNCGGPDIESDTLVIDNVTISPAFTFSAENIEVSVCQGDTVTLNISDFGGPTTGYYLWEGDLGDFNSTEIELTYSDDAIFDYLLTWTDIDSVCTQTVEYEIAFLDIPTFSITEEIICLGEDLDIELSISQPISFIEYGSDISPTQISSSENITLSSPELNEVYTIDVTYENGCVSSQIFEPFIESPFIQIIPENPSICAGSDIALFANSTAGTSTITWTEENNPGTIISSTATLNLNITESTSYVATFDNGNCIVSDTVTVVITENPEISISQSIEEPCEGTIVTIDIDSFSDGDGSIIWTYGPQGLPESQNGNGNSFEITALLGETLTINWQDDYGICTADDSFLIDAVPPPSLQITGFPNDTTDIYCPDELVSITATGLADGQVYWSGACMGTPFSNVTINFPACGTSGWLYVESTDTDCPVKDSVYLVIDSPEDLLISNFDSSCEGDTLTFIALGGYNDNSAYSWDFTGGYDGYVETDEENGTIQFLPAASGILTLSYDAPLVCTPVPDATFVVDILPYYVPIQNALTGQEILGDTIELCVGESITLNNPLNTTQELEWISCDGTLIMEDDIIINLNEESVCTITATIIEGCPFSREITIIAFEPELTNVDSEYEICANEDLIFDFSEADSCVWLTTDFISNIESCSPMFNYNQNLTQQQLLDYDFEIWQNGCSKLYETQIRVYPNTEVKVPADTTVCAGSFPFIALDNSTCQILTWTPSIDIEIFEDTEYTLTAECGECDYELKVMVLVDDGCSECDALNVPSAITPNGDGFNDTWDIGCPGAQVQIVNRAGAPVESYVDYQNQFDGKNGTMSGTYYYTIIPPDGSPMITGSLTIIK